MSRKDHARTLGGALGWGVAARVARMALGLIGTAVVVRLLGTHDYGVLAVVRTALAYVAIVVGAGLSQGLLRYLPAWRLGSNAERIRSALVASLSVHVLIWAIVALLVLIGRPALEGFTGPTVAGLMVLGVLVILPEVFSHTATNIANAYYDTKSISVAVVVATGLYVGLVTVFLNQDRGVAGVLIAAAIANLVLAVFLLSRVPGYLRQKPPEGDVPPKPPRVRQAVRYSVPFLAIGLLNLITWRQSEVLFLGHFHGAEVAGFFDLAYRLPQTVLEFVPGAIWPLVMAGSAEAFVRDPSALQRTTAAYYKLLFLLVAPLGWGGFLVGDLMVRLLGGAEFAEAGVFCQVFFLIMTVSFFTTPLSMAFYVVERPSVGLVLYLINAVVNVGLDLLLIPRFGLWGAVVPVALIIVTSPFVNAWVLRRMGITIRPPWGFLVRIHAAAALMLVLWPLRHAIAGPGGLFALVGMGAVVFLIGLRVFRVFGPLERDLMERASPAAWSILQPVVAGRAPRVAK